MAVIFDIGGTKIRSCLFDTKGKIVRKISDNTPKSTDKLKEFISTVYKDFSAGTKDSCVLGVAGLVGSNKVEFSPNIKYLEGLNFSSWVPFYSKQQSYSILPFMSVLDESKKVVVCNDAILAGIGEYFAGSGRGYERVAYITLSTGVGGGFIQRLSGSIYAFSAEPGHIHFHSMNAVDKGCDREGCAQTLLSGTSFKQIYKQDPSECKNDVVWNDYSKKLSDYLFSLWCVWKPDVFVLGGGISNKFPEFENFLKSHMQKDFIKGCIPTVLKSHLGDDAALVGGYALLTQKDITLI